VLRSCGICAGTFVRRISHGKDRVPLRQHHARHHRAHPAFKRRLDRCTPPLFRSLGWNRRRFGVRSFVDGASTRVREAKRRIRRSGGRVARNPHDFAADTAATTEVSLADARNARILRPAGNEFGKLSWMQDSSENLKTVDNARSRAREIGARVHEINLAVKRSGN
jgi:hypothetical protein